MAIPLSGTFDYRVVMTRDAASQHRWSGKGRSMRDSSIHPGLFGKRPIIELEYSLLSLRPADSKLSTLTNRHLRRQRVADRDSCEVGGAPAAAIHHGDQLFFHRFGTGDYGLTILREESLILALGSCTHLHLGSEIQVQEDARIAELEMYELAKVLDGMNDPDSQVIWVDTGKSDLAAQIQQIERAPQCENLIVLIKGATPRNFYDKVFDKGNAECISCELVDSRFADKDSWLTYVKHLPRERPKDLFLSFIAGDERIDLCEGEEAGLGSYYVRVDRIYRLGTPGKLSSLAIARESSGVPKGVVIESADLVLRGCVRGVPRQAAPHSLFVRLPFLDQTGLLEHRGTLMGALMDARFHPGIAAIKSGEIDALVAEAGPHSGDGSFINEPPNVAPMLDPRSLRRPEQGRDG